MTTIVALAAVTLGLAQGNNIDNDLQANLRDATFVARIVKGDQTQLKKINSDFGQTYRFTTSTIYFKEPLKMRAEAHVEETSVVYIINGTHLEIKLPSFVSKQDLSKSPGRRQTLMDVGILTPALMENLFDAKFVRSDRESGDAVFDLTYKPELNDTSRNRVWIDPKKKYVTRREWFNQYNRQLATFYYLNPQEINGVWVPTRLEVKNVDGVIAGITRYESIKVNSGLPDSLFSIK